MLRNPIDNKYQTVQTAALTTQTANSGTYQEGICPHCNNQMAVSQADSDPVWVCIADRTALPIKSITPTL